MSKQDRQGVRTATDLERKYGFGQSFAEIYGLAEDAKRLSEEAKDAADKVYENMTPEQIFYMLTKFGAEQGVFRGADGKLYINAAYLYGTILAGQELEVNAATVKGTLNAVDIESGQISGSEILVRDSFEYPTQLTDKSAIHIVPLGMTIPIGSIYYNFNTAASTSTELSAHNLWITTQDSIYDSVGASIKIDAGHRLSLEANDLIYIASANKAVNFGGTVNFSGATVTGLTPTAVFG